MDSVGGVIQRRWWVLLLPVVLVSVLVVLVHTARPGRYEAVATIRGPSSDLATTASLMFRSQASLQSVIRHAALADDPPDPRRLATRLDATPDGDQLLRISYAADDPEEAQVVAKAAADLLLQQRRRQAAEANDARIAAAADRVERREVLVEEARAALVAFERRHPVPRSGEPAPPRTVDAEGRQLAAELEAHQGALRDARFRLDEAELAAEEAMRQIRAERLVDRPLAPVDSSWPLWLVGLPVLAAGVAIGVMLTLLAERRDDTVRDEVDVQDAAPGVPILAVVDP